jgi:hypothetical protein
MITWQFWTLLGALVVVGFDLSSSVGKIADHLEALNELLIDLARARRGQPPLAAPLPSES